MNARSTSAREPAATDDPDPLAGAFDRAFDEAEHRAAPLWEAREHVVRAQEPVERLRVRAVGVRALVRATEPRGHDNDAL